MDNAHSHAGSHGLRTAHPVPIRHQLELRVDADPFWMSSLRALITDLAIRADFDLDAVADLTLAVDEACAVLIGAASAKDALTCRFAVGVDSITVTATVPGGWDSGRPKLPMDTFGWRVIETLTDDVELCDREGMLGIRLTKCRMAAGG